MKIVRPADGSLVIQVRPGIMEYFLGLGLLLPVWIFPTQTGLAWDQIAAVLAASFICGGFLVYIAEIADYRFDADRNQFRWHRKRLYNSLHGQVPLADVREINLASRLSSDGDVEVHQVALTLPSGDLALTQSFASGRAYSENVAKAILAYLNEHGFHPVARGISSRIESQ